MSARRPVAVLRPEPGNGRTAAAARALGLVAIRLPLFAVVPVAWMPPDPGRFDAVAATSANAFRHGGAGLMALHGLPVVAIGPATAAAARAAGFAVDAVGSGDAAALAALAGDRRLLHLAGAHHRALPGAEAVVVYAAEPLPIAAARVAALAGAVALLHSTRAARRLAALVPPDARATIRLAAIAPAVAAAAGDGWRRIAAADRPRDDVLLALAADLAAAD